MDILESLQPYEDLIREDFLNIKSNMQSYKADIENAKNTERLLRIGIVGQVKAGKSSLLNALLFEGESVLPKAATPMTAALTIIKYGESFKAEVQFYTTQDWNDMKAAYEEYKRRYIETKRILEQGQQGGGLFGRQSKSEEIDHIQILTKSKMPEEWKAAAEIITMVEKNGIDVYKYLDSSAVAEDITMLSEYVGTKGKFTPIVRNVTLYYNFPKLKDIEIIDTPGINDPIVSRGRATKSFLGQCDAVFMLSICSHFMDTSDLQLLAQNLPEKGIKDIVIIGSQFDAELKGEREKSKNMPALIRRLCIKWNDHCKSTFEDKKAQSQNEEEKKIMERLIAALPPIYTSSMAYTIAKHLPDLDGNDTFYFEGLNNIYKDFTFDRDTLMELANISSIEKKLEQYKSRRQEILENRLTELMQGMKKGISIKLGKMLQETKTRISRLKTEDIEKLKKREAEVTSRISKGRGKIEAAFEAAICKMETDMAILKTEIKRMSLNFTGFNIQSESHTESYDVTVTKRFLWVIPYDTTETRYRTVTYRYAYAHDAIDKVEEFVCEAQSQIQQAIMKIININELRSKIKEAAMSLFDLNDASFEPEDILLPLERTISRITIPDIDIAKKDFTQVITSQFSGKVSEGQLEGLKQAQRAAISQVEEEIHRLVSDKTQEISKGLENQCTQFADNLTNDIKADLEALREQLKDRENVIERYIELKEALENMDI